MNNSNNYSLINESILLPALLSYGAYSALQSMSQTQWNSRMLYKMQVELSKCDPRNRRKALEIVNRYSTQLTQLYGKSLSKGAAKKLAITQNLINNTFKYPLEQIINNSQSVNWKRDLDFYLQKNITKIRRQQNTRNLISAAALGTGAAAAGGLATSVTAPVGLSLFGYNVLRTQLSHFNSLFYLNRMAKEMEACQTREEATAIVDRYCYQISKDLGDIVIKSGKKIPMNIQLQLRRSLAQPLFGIINNQTNKYWKIVAVDYIKSQKAQQNIQYVCNTLSQLVVPTLMTQLKGLNLFGNSQPQATVQAK